MSNGVQLLFYQTDADCFFIAQPLRFTGKCDLGPGERFGIIAARLPGGI